MQLSKDAGFVMHQERSNLTPSKQSAYLGFSLDLESMTVQFALEKACKELLKTKSSSTIYSKLTQVVDMMVASFPGVKFGTFHYKLCDNLKATKENKGNFKAIIEIPNE